MRKIGFNIPGVCRTKKTSNRIVRMGNFTKILPSAAYEEWFKNSLVYAPGIRRAIRSSGINLPLQGPLTIRALFYRDAERGDLCGFLQALGDFLQEPRIAQTGKRKGNPIRNGAGIIADDSQIESFDGSRLLKDPDRPRIEVTILFEEDLLTGI